MYIFLFLALTLSPSGRAFHCREVLWKSVNQTSFLLPASSRNSLTDNGSGLHIGVLVRVQSEDLVWARGHVIINRHEGAVNDVDRAYQLITEALPALAPRGKPRLYTRERSPDLVQFPHLDPFMNANSANFRHSLLESLVRPVWILEGLRLDRKSDEDRIKVDKDLEYALDTLEMAMEMLQMHHHGIPLGMQRKIGTAKDRLFFVRLMTQHGTVEARYLKTVADQQETLYEVVQMIRQSEPSEVGVLVMGR